MLKQVLVILFILIAVLSFGQDFTYPAIRSSGKTIADLTPQGWMVLDSATGDLNGDGAEDMALVFQHGDSVTIVKEEDGYVDTVLTQPRILGLLFFNKKTKSYDLIAQSNTFILDHDNPQMDEPYRAISISNRVLQIDFFIWYSMGSWYMSNNDYKFRYQNKEFMLIGADYNSVHRASGEVENKSYNFLTKKMSIGVGSISNDKVKTSWHKIELKQMKTLRTFTRPFTWEEFGL